MFLVPAFALGFLVVTIGARVLSRPFVVVRAGMIFWTAVLGVSAVLTIMSHLQFEAWANGALITQHLVPPLGGHRYFLLYIWWRFWAPYVISFVISGIFFWLARFYNRRHDGGFFYDDEYYFIALGIFLTGQPGWIFYLLAMAIIAFFITLVRHIFLHRMDKVSLYDFWLPVAVFVILSMTWLEQLSWFALLKT